MQSVLDKLSYEDQKVINDYIRQVIIRQAIVSMIIFGITIKLIMG